MPYENYAWWDVTNTYFQIKFTSTVDPATLINENFVVYTTEATPTVVPDPFFTIDLAKDYSSISRVINLWWENPPVTGTYTLHCNNLKNFLGETIADFTIEFNWVLESATPGEESVVEQRPNRVPVEVEDYSIKTPGWSIVSSANEVVFDPANSLEILDIAPGPSRHHHLSVSENEGKVDLLFPSPVAANFMTPYYFIVSSKKIKKGIATWEPVQVLVSSNLDSTLVNLYLPAAEGLIEDPQNFIYSINLTKEEIESHTFFEPQTKYRVIVSTEVGL